MTAHVRHGVCFCREFLALTKTLIVNAVLYCTALTFCFLFLFHHIIPIARPFSLTTQDPSTYPQPSSQDLASFWELLQLNIEDVRVKFQDLQRLKDSGWRLPEKKVRSSGVQTASVSLQHHPKLRWQRAQE